jgi:hypothetical protein
MRLWSAEMDGERAEARAAVAQGFAAFREILGPREDDAAAGSARDAAAVARERRGHMARYAVAVPEAVEQSIAGVRCRVFRPEERARAVYLHFHGGGMVTGLPEMNDIPNRELARRHGIAVVSVDYRLAPEHPYCCARATSSAPPTASSARTWCSASTTGDARRASAASGRTRAPTCSIRPGSSSSPSATCRDGATTSAATRRSRRRSPTCAACRPR